VNCCAAFTHNAASGRIATYGDAGKIMSFRFIGESSPELRRYPPEQRRAIYFRAVKASYGNSKTWIGLLLFISVLGQGGWSPVVGLVCMGSLQVLAIRDYLARIADSEIKSAPLNH
jgi:hypothetical protein